MQTLLQILLGIAMIAVVGVLATGIISFVAGGEFNRRYANLLMRWRVITQAVAIVIVLLLLLLRGTGTSGADLTFAPPLAAEPRSECQIQSSTSII
jgi:hypothetical protein